MEMEVMEVEVMIGRNRSNSDMINIIFFSMCFYWIYPNVCHFSIWSKPLNKVTPKLFLSFIQPVLIYNVLFNSYKRLISVKALLFLSPLISIFLSFSELNVSWLQLFNTRNLCEWHFSKHLIFLKWIVYSRHKLINCKFFHFITQSVISLILNVIENPNVKK